MSKKDDEEIIRKINEIRAGIKSISELLVDIVKLRGADGLEFDCTLGVAYGEARGAYAIKPFSVKDGQIEYLEEGDTAGLSNAKINQPAVLIVENILRKLGISETK